MTNRNDQKNPAAYLEKERLPECALIHVPVNSIVLTYSGRVALVGSHEHGGRSHQFLGPGEGIARVVYANGDKGDLPLTSHVKIIKSAADIAADALRPWRQHDTDAKNYGTVAQMIARQKGTSLMALPLIFKENARQLTPQNVRDLLVTAAETRGFDRDQMTRAACFIMDKVVPPIDSKKMYDDNAWADWFESCCREFHGLIKVIDPS